MWRAALILFAMGATVGSALDAIHTHSQTTVYTSPIFWMMAWWTPPLFGSAGVGAGLAYAVFERLRGREVARDVPWSRVAVGFTIFVAMYAASGWLPASNAVKLIVLAVGAAVVALINARTAQAIGIACIAALVGPLVEITLVHRGVFRHLQPDVLGIPIWLPALYATASFALGVLGKKLVARPSATPSLQRRALP